MYANEMSAQKLCVCVCVFVLANVINAGAFPAVSHCQGEKSICLSAIEHLRPVMPPITSNTRMCVCVYMCVFCYFVSLFVSPFCNLTVVIFFSVPPFGPACLFSVSLLNLLSTLNLSAITPVLKNDTTCLPFCYHTVSLYSYFQL